MRKLFNNPYQHYKCFEAGLQINQSAGGPTFSWNKNITHFQGLLVFKAFHTDFHERPMHAMASLGLSKLEKTSFRDDVTLDYYMGTNDYYGRKRIAKFGNQNVQSAYRSSISKSISQILIG
jgi:hypothetical protein